MTPEDLVAELAAFRSAEAPVPGAALRDLFASGAVVAAPAAAPAPARRTPMSMPKRLLATVPSKIAAGVVGALLAGSLGAGAMTGTISLTSQESDAPAEVVEPQDAVVAAPADIEADEVDEVDEVADDVADAEDGAEEPKADAGDPTTAPVPTSVDEAAHNHQFDEACGNHGAYVSHFARTGEEPECALTARTGGEAADPATDVETDQVATTDADQTDDDAKGHGQGQGQAKAEAKKAARVAGGSKAKGGHRQA